MSGFQITSRGLPGIRRYLVKPHLDVDASPVEPPSNDAELPRYWRDFDAIEGNVVAKGVTVAPTAPRPQLSRLWILSRPSFSHKEQAIQQGWIKDQGIGISLDAKLNAAGAALARGQNRAATNVLNALLNEVDAQADKQLSPEAVALLNRPG